MKNVLLILAIGILFSFCSSSKNSINETHRISKRAKSGKIENRVILDSLLIAVTHNKIDSLKPLVVIYYPGKDFCSSSGSSTRKSTKIWFDKMEKGINKIAASNILYIYKDSTGLYGRHDGYREWFQDPKNVLKTSFSKIMNTGVIVL